MVTPEKFWYWSQIFFAASTFLLVLYKAVEDFIKAQKRYFENQIKDLNEFINNQKQEMALIRSQKKSSEVRLGQIAEQLTPFLDHFKYDPKKCQFLGQPIDYIVFDQNEVVFIEVKTGNARLTDSQKKIRNNVNAKRVRFEEIRIK
jgi:predicted Holliday junction resolvase-like endonuclease